MNGTGTIATGASLAARPHAAAPVLAVRDAVKSFGPVRALQGVSLDLEPGELLGLLGPNGAGKTTLLRAIAGGVRLDGGAIELLGAARPVAERRRALGMVPQSIALYPLLTARENLEAFGALHGVAPGELRDRVDWALGWTGLGERSRQIVKQFSGGMKRRLNIACGVLHQPRLVLLDEPTEGVDPQSRERIYEMLDGLRRDGASLLLTTHQLEEAERRCDRIVIIDHGQVVAAGTLAELLAGTLGEGRTVTLVLERPSDRVPQGFEVGPDGRLTARVARLGAELPALLARAQAAGLEIEDIEVRRHGLHEVFLKLTGRELRE